MENETKTTYRVPEENLWKLNRNIAKLNKRAAKLGLQPVVVTEESVEEVEIMERSITWEIDGGMEPSGRFKRVHILSFIGVTPKLAGWTLQGVLERADIEGETECVNIVRPVPGIELPAIYRSREAVCDHCKKFRRRNETFVVKNESGEYKQVGRNCLVDFLGGADPAALLEASEWLFHVDAALSEAEGDGYDPAGRVREYIPLQRVLEVTSMIIRKDGWVSRKQGMQDPDKCPTSTLVNSYFYTLHRDKSFPPAEYTVTEEDTVQAEKAIEWTKTLANSPNEYLYNLSVIGRASKIHAREFGLACSIVAAWKREMGYRLEHANQREIDTKSEYFGTIGQRVEFEATVEKVIATSSQFGALDIHKMRTSEDNILTWFCSNGSPLEIGKSYKLIGTIKKHEEYRGAKQTVVSRVKIASPPKEKKVRKHVQKRIVETSIA